MGTLYELSTMLRNIFEELDDCDSDEKITELMNTVFAVEGDLSRKGETYVKIMRNMQSDIDAIKTEKERLDKMQKRRELAIERMKEYIRMSMTAAGLKYIETPLGKWARRMSPWSCVILDESKVEDRFKIPQPPKIDKKAMLDEFKETGEILSGADFQQKEYVIFR